MLALPLGDLPTRSASGFLIRYVLPRSLPPQLIGPMDRKQPFQMLTISDAIIGVGHGDDSSFCGHNNQVVMDILSIPNVKGKIVILIACETAQLLGPELIEKGAASYIGFKDDLVWVVDADLAFTPWSDKLAKSVMLPITSCVNTILDGKTTGEAFNTMQEYFSRNAALEEDDLIRSCINFNQKNAVLLGCPEARVTARPPLPLPFSLIPPPPILLPLAS